MSIPMTMTYFDPAAAPGSTSVQSRNLTLTIVAQDPAVTNVSNRRILRAPLRIPASHLEPGPRGARFHVVDYHGGEHELGDPIALVDAAGASIDYLAPGRMTDKQIRAGA